MELKIKPSDMKEAIEVVFNILNQADPRYNNYLPNTSASVVLLTEVAAKEYTKNCIIVEDPYLAYAIVSRLFVKESKKTKGIHKGAFVEDSSKIHSSVSIGANSVIGRNVVIGKDSVIGAGVVLLLILGGFIFYTKKGGINIKKIFKWIEL